MTGVAEPAPLRIAFVYDALYPWVNGGAERRYHALASRLAERHDVHMVSWQWWDGPAVIRRDGMTLHGVGRPPSLYGSDGKRTVREAVGFSARLLPTLLRGRFDVIDCSATPYLPLYATWLASRLTRTPLVATWHEFWGEHWSTYLPDRPMVARAARGLEAGARRLGDRLVAVSEFTAGAMGMAGAPRLRVVPNGVDAGALMQADPHPDGAELICLGRLIDEKRVDLLVEAFAEVAARVPGVRCDVIGDGPELPALRGQAARLGLADRVRFLGRVPADEVPRRLRAAKILVQPSSREGYGMVVAEAQAAGVVPVVADGPFTAAPDLVRDGVDGLVVEPSAAALAGAVSMLLADPDRRAAMSRAARSAGASRDWGRLAAEMEQVYRHAMAADPAAPPLRSVEWL